eukprot:4205358-Pleurochrysis_carterae.AAC.1
MSHPGAAPAGACRLQRSTADAARADAAWQSCAQGLNPESLSARAHPLCPCLHYTYLPFFRTSPDVNVLCYPELHLCCPPYYQFAHLGMPSFYGLTDY